jgi:hypothetical protein
MIFTDVKQIVAPSRWQAMAPLQPRPPGEVNLTATEIRLAKA